MVEDFRRQRAGADVVSNLIDEKQKTGLGPSFFWRVVVVGYTPDGDILVKYFPGGCELPPNAKVIDQIEPGDVLFNGYYNVHGGNIMCAVAGSDEKAIEPVSTLPRDWKPI